MRLAAFAAALLLFVGCDTTDEGICTTEFVSIGVRVVDAAGTPVSGLTTTVTNLRTGKSIFSRTLSETDGVYLVLSDTNGSFVAPDGDRVRFEASNESYRAETDYTIGADACHIRLLDGPESEIVAETLVAAE